LAFSLYFFFFFTHRDFAGLSSLVPRHFEIGFDFDIVVGTLFRDQL
jgi:hypothetical protein